MYYKIEPKAGLRWANLSDANLSGANLSDADLRWANLYGANLSEASLYKANLRGANLYVANLYKANLYKANLSEANLSEANLRYANLREANLREADLRGAIGNGREIKSAQLDPWRLTWTKDILAIGCQQHVIADWEKFDDETISKMDSRMLAWWKANKDIVLAFVKGSFNTESE